MRINFKMKEPDSVQHLDDYFGVLKWALKCVGLSVSPNLSLPYKIYSHCLLFSMLLYATLMSPDLFKFSKDFDTFIDTWLFATGYFGVLIKMIALYLNRGRLYVILNKLQSGVFLPNLKRGGELEFNLLRHATILTRKLTVAGTVVGLGTMSGSVVGAYLYYMNTGNKKLPFGSIDIVNDNSPFEASLFYNSFSYGMGVEAFMLVDIVYASVLAHICVQCEILQNFIRKTTETSRNEMAQQEGCAPVQNHEIPYKYLQQNLKKIVLHHMAILQIGEDIEAVFNIPTLCVFTEMSVCFCFIMYQGSLYPILDPNFIKDFLVLITAMLPLIINSYWGSEVLFGSQGVAHACYELDFIGTDIKFQKSLVLIIQRSQRPIRLTVGKFAVLSLVTMLGVMRMSYSYFMLLRKVNTK